MCGRKRKEKDRKVIPENKETKTKKKQQQINNKSYKGYNKGKKCKKAKAKRNSSTFCKYFLYSVD